MPQECTNSSLVSSASCFQCLSSKQLAAVKAYVLMQMADYDLLPQQLLARAIAFTTLSEKQIAGIQTHLLCQILSPSDVLPNGPFIALNARGTPIEWDAFSPAPAYWLEETSNDNVTWTFLQLIPGTSTSQDNSGLPSVNYFRITGVDSDSNPVTKPSNAIFPFVPP